MTVTTVDLKVFEARNRLKKLRPLKIDKVVQKENGDLLYYAILHEHFGVKSMKELETDEQKDRLAALLNDKAQEIEQEKQD